MLKIGTKQIDKTTLILVYKKFNKKIKSGCHAYLLALTLQPLLPLITNEDDLQILHCELLSVIKQNAALFRSSYTTVNLDFQSVNDNGLDFFRIQKEHTNTSLICQDIVYFPTNYKVTIRSEYMSLFKVSAAPVNTE